MFCYDWCFKYIQFIWEILLNDDVDDDADFHRLIYGDVDAVAGCVWIWIGVCCWQEEHILNVYVVSKSHYNDGLQFSHSVIKYVLCLNTRWLFSLFLFFRDSVLIASGMRIELILVTITSNTFYQFGSNSVRERMRSQLEQTAEVSNSLSHLKQPISTHLSACYSNWECSFSYRFLPRKSDVFCPPSSGHPVSILNQWMNSW